MSSNKKIQGLYSNVSNEVGGFLRILAGDYTEEKAGEKFCMLAGDGNNWDERYWRLDSRFKIAETYLNGLKKENLTDNDRKALHEALNVVKSDSKWAGKVSNTSLERVINEYKIGPERTEIEQDVKVNSYKEQGARIISLGKGRTTERFRGIDGIVGEYMLPAQEDPVYAGLNGKSGGKLLVLPIEQRKAGKVSRNFLTVAGLGTLALLTFFGVNSYLSNEGSRQATPVTQRVSSDHKTTPGGLKIPDTIKVVDLSTEGDKKPEDENKKRIGRIIEISPADVEDLRPQAMSQPRVQEEETVDVPETNYEPELLEEPMTWAERVGFDIPPRTQVRMYVEDELRGSYVPGDNSLERTVNHLRNAGDDTFGDGGDIKDVNEVVVEDGRGSYRETFQRMGTGVKNLFGKESTLTERVGGLWSSTVGGVVRLAGNTTQAAEDVVDAVSELTFGTASNIPGAGKVFDVANKAVQVTASTAQNAAFGDGWHRVHKMSLEEGVRGLPVVYNLTTAPVEAADEDSGAVEVRNTPLRRGLETAGSLLVDLLTLQWLSGGDVFGGEDGVFGGDGIFNGGGSGGNGITGGDLD
ncbi:hypothetical protein HYT58_02185 [Candidatus Woesearchaeota archaeon]|nr:hypothetical protein [Candidatus Woesearchaeota archaeon]